MERRGSCLVLPITMDCMWKLVRRVRGRLVEGRLSDTFQEHMQDPRISSKCSRASSPCSLPSKLTGMAIPQARCEVLHRTHYGNDWSSSSPIWETKRYASPSLWQVPLMTGMCRRRLSLIASSSTRLPVINVAGVLLIEYELNCTS